MVAHRHPPRRGKRRLPKPGRTRYLYDTGTFNLIMSYSTHWQTGVYQTADHSFLWGPDLSGSLTGAGGIGGMAITYNDGADQGSGGGPGAMLPAYDGNGNLTDLVAATPGGGGSECGTNPVCPVASYEYGPFGEVRSMTGSQATANPMRWSTKFTDNETGLVYYGYRYYHAGLGRWGSRDPLQEFGGINLNCFVRNNGIDSVDAFGLQTFVKRLNPLPRVPRENRILIDTHERQFLAKMEVSSGQAQATKIVAKTLLDSLRVQLYFNGALSLVGYGFKDGARFVGAFDHFLSGSGSRRTEVFSDFVRETEAGKALAQSEVLAAYAAADALMKSGRALAVDVSHEKWHVGSIDMADSMGWYGYFRGYKYFSYATLNGRTSESCNQEFVVDMYIYKDYNFDDGEVFGIPKILGDLDDTLNGTNLNTLALGGLAKNFDVVMSGRARFVTQGSRDYHSNWFESAKDWNAWSNPGFDPSLMPSGAP